MKKILAYELRIKELEEFKSQHHKVWGALSVEELAIFARADTLLIQQDPVAFMERNHDAIFNRKVIEENKERYCLELARITRNLEIAEAGVPALEEELAALKRRLSDQKNQTAIQIQRVDSLEQELAVCQYQLKISNVQWMEAGKRADALESAMAILAVENESMKARLTRVVRAPQAEVSQPVVQNGSICVQADVDSVVVSLYSRIVELRAKCHCVFRE